MEMSPPPARPPMSEIGPKAAPFPEPAAKRGWRKQMAYCLIGAALAVISGLATLVLPLTQGMVGSSYDLPYFFRPKMSVDDAVIVYLDDQSHKELDQPYDRAWDRSLHARLVRQLTTN